MDWGKRGAFGGHKSLCARYKWLGREQRVPPEEHRTMVAELVRRTKLYLCPFFVHHAEQSGGGGFGFVQSECTLAELALPAPRDAWGRALMRPRSLLLMWMSLDEFPEYVAETGDDRVPSQELLATAAPQQALHSVESKCPGAALPSAPEQSGLAARFRCRREAVVGAAGCPKVTDPHRLRTD